MVTPTYCMNPPIYRDLDKLIFYLLERGLTVEPREPKDKDPAKLWLLEELDVIAPKKYYMYTITRFNGKTGKREPVEFVGKRFLYYMRYRIERRQK